MTINKKAETRLRKAYASRTSDSASGIELHARGRTASLDDPSSISLIKDLIPAARLLPAEQQELIDFIRNTYREDDTDNPVHESSTLGEIRAAAAEVLRDQPPSYIPGAREQEARAHRGLARVETAGADTARLHHESAIAIYADLGLPVAASAS